MSQKAVVRFDVLPETQGEIDTREVPRFGCGGRPILRVLVRPSLQPMLLALQDLSLKGAGFLSDGPIIAGATLALLWAFGPPERWRTLRARVARTSPRRRGGWIIGCAFEERLQYADLQAFLLQEYGGDGESQP